MASQLSSQRSAVVAPAPGLGGGSLKRKLHRFAFQSRAKKIVLPTFGRFGYVSSATHDLQASNCKFGYASVDETKRWPIIVAKDVFVQHPSAALYRRRAESNVGMGVMMHSDYTGQLCQETGMRLAAQGTSKVSMCISGRDIVSWAACDGSPLSQAVIKQAQAHLRPPNICSKE